jgi:cytochrome b subunit of formate dehydrogenase
MMSPASPVRNLVAIALLLGLALSDATAAWAQDDELCLICHREEDMRSGPDAIPVPHVDEAILAGSVHPDAHCLECHPDAVRTLGESDARPDPSQTYHENDLAPAACGVCHQDQAVDHELSVHGQMLLEGDQDVPRCQSCHGDHDMQGPRDPRSKVYPLALPATCAVCHADERLATKHSIEVANPYQRYLTSVHGQGLISSGLLLSATCNDCHGTHLILRHEDPQSTINHANVAATCGACHAGVQAAFVRSVHAQPPADDPEAEMPTCTVCHESHGIQRIVSEGWRLHIITECAGCHEDLLDTYRETYHGQVTSLGFTNAARCSDCHGAHDILPSENPDSTVSGGKIVETCQQCHPGANESFVQFLAHGDRRDRERYPVLFYSYWAMTLLLIGVFSFFSVHTLLWFIRSLIAFRKRPRHADEEPQTYQRFRPFERFLHLLVITSFMGLVLTGIPLKFAYAGWAQTVMGVLGGVPTAGALHRFFALITFLYFGLHLLSMAGRLFRRQRGLFWGPDSLVPQPKDLLDMLRHFKWFVGLGPRPKFDRWTYWEKFDYMAVFWGVAIIGASGLILWFPEFFGSVLPGWIFNVALIVHSDEALMAAGFIFTIHFFNSHFRPEKFPIDPVIFTGRISLEELREERPLEYERLVAAGELEGRLEEPVHQIERRWARAFGLVALTAGVILLVLILWAVLFG